MTVSVIYIELPRKKNEKSRELTKLNSQKQNMDKNNKVSIETKDY